MDHSQKVHETNLKGSADHVECARRGSVALSDEIEYDHDGIRGIVRSPYVFGAALLASFGGFSFGYGEKPALSFSWGTTSNPFLRSRSYLPNSGHAPVS